MFEVKSEKKIWEQQVVYRHISFIISSSIFLPSCLISLRPRLCIFFSGDETSKKHKKAVKLDLNINY